MIMAFFTNILTYTFSLFQTPHILITTDWAAIRSGVQKKSSPIKENHNWFFKKIEKYTMCCIQNSSLERRKIQNIVQITAYALIQCIIKSFCIIYEKCTFLRMEMIKTAPLPNARKHSCLSRVLKDDDLYGYPVSQKCCHAK